MGSFHFGWFSFFFAAIHSLYDPFFKQTVQNIFFKLMIFNSFDTAQTAFYFTFYEFTESVKIVSHLFHDRLVWYLCVCEHCSGTDTYVYIVWLHTRKNEPSISFWSKLIVSMNICLQFLQCPLFLSIKSIFLSYAPHHIT